MRIYLFYFNIGINTVESRLSELIGTTPSLDIGYFHT